MPSVCEGAPIGVWAHKFEPRYDTQPVQMPTGLLGQQQVYVCDICQRCGETVYRRPPRP